MGGADPGSGWVFLWQPIAYNRFNALDADLCLRI